MAGAPDVFVPARAFDHGRTAEFLRGLFIDTRGGSVDGSSPAATIEGFSMLVSRPVNACVSITSSMPDSTSIFLYAGGAMLSCVAMNLVPM